MRRPFPLLGEARRVLERYLFDGETCRDDVAEVCQKIDDVLPPNAIVPAQKVDREAA